MKIRAKGAIKVAPGTMHVYCAEYTVYLQQSVKRLKWRDPLFHSLYQICCTAVVPGGEHRMNSIPGMSHHDGHEGAPRCLVKRWATFHLPVSKQHQDILQVYTHIIWRDSSKHAVDIKHKSHLPPVSCAHAVAPDSVARNKIPLAQEENRT